MNTPATDCAIHVAYWFFNRAEEDSSFINMDKIQHLLFLAQVNYASKNNMEVLMPCVFICDKDGFNEPSLKCILSQGRPFMPPVQLGEKVNNFLENIWNKYGSIPMEQLSTFIKSTRAYKDNYFIGTKNIVSIKSLVESFVSSGSISQNKPLKTPRKKVLLSQNGPVLVSKWQPRKIALNKIKGE